MFKFECEFCWFVASGAVFLATSEKKKNELLTIYQRGLGGTREWTSYIPYKGVTNTLRPPPATRGSSSRRKLNPVETTRLTE